EPGKSLFTGVLTDKEIARLDLIRHSPGIFQELVPKSYELRVTVVGERLFSVRIDSQAHVETRMDWRRAPLAPAYAPAELPPAVAAKIKAFMAALGLIYAAIDLIVTPQHRHVFLEANPGGQYMWVEAKTGLGITAALADALGAACGA